MTFHVQPKEISRQNAVIARAVFSIEAALRFRGFNFDDETAEAAQNRKRGLLPAPRSAKGASGTSCNSSQRLSPPRYLFTDSSPKLLPSACSRLQIVASPLPR